MKLPNAENAVVDIRKLVDYCLSTEHSRGRNKARVFASSLGFHAEDALTLQNTLLDAARSNEATALMLDEYGQRYVIDFQIEGLNGLVTVRSRWIIRRNENFPRLTTCYIL